ncbi:SRPBCC family protein [Winogradskyella sp. A3E31]|uniref:SRPBCC family protein n=1 Tax=Winogradskyella sp. A3E31 TaxID=3349637 RepID=UPI00398B3581
MKYLKYILGTLAILLIIFLLIGVLKPDISYDSEIVVDKPLEESWQVMQDESKMAEWMDGFQNVEHVSGQKGTVGSVSNVYFITDGQEMTIKETITDLKPNESIEMLFETDFMDMDYKLNMTALNGKTKITSHTTVKGNGMFSKSFIALVGSSFKSQEDTNLMNLKDVIESNTKNYFPVEKESVEPDSD